MYILCILHYTCACCMIAIPHPTQLAGKTVDLLPLEEKHFDALLTAASDKKIWQFYPGDWSVPEKFHKVYTGTLKAREKGLEYPFVIVHKASQRIIGSTRLMDISQYDNRLEIGGTWLVPEYWATEINPDCKLTLLTYCFETLKTNRVQLKTQHDNIRSRKAIEKIGATYEGVIREHILKDDCSYRSSAYFSILMSEWPAVKENLSRLLEVKMRRNVSEVN
jgi:RimJ/RimL family protein N-acetyltransferase